MPPPLRLLSVACSLVGGVVADAVDRKRLILITQTVMLLSAAALAAALPGTAAFFTTSARVSSDSDPLYVPFVWHLTQWAFRMGTTSWAK